MQARLDGAWVGQDGDEELQERYKSLFPPQCTVKGFLSRIGADFLRQNEELLPLGSRRICIPVV